MQCTSPVLIRNPRSVFGDRYSFGLWVPCGHCTSCRIAHAREWATRLLHELEFWEDSSFITLTFDDDHLPEDKSIHKEDLQLFFKRFRKRLGDRKIRYYACGEYGEERGRPHYHAILFGFGSLSELYYDRGLKAYRSKLIDECWSFGHNTVGSVTYDSCRYVADYVGKKYNGEKAKEVYGERQVPFQIQSLSIGKRFAQANADRLRSNLGCTVHGVQAGLPRYYRKILNITTEEMAVKAQERQEALDEYYNERGVYSEADFAVALSEARKQASRNVQARLSLFSRDSF